MTEEEKIIDKRLRDWRKKISDREDIRLMKLLKNIDINNISTKPWPKNEKELLARIEDTQTIKKYWVEFLQELTEIFGPDFEVDTNISSTISEDLYSQSIHVLEKDLQLKGYWILVQAKIWRL